MKKAYFLFIFCIGTLSAARAQTTLSFTSRGDLGSVKGFAGSTDNFYIFESSKKIGVRASFGIEVASLVSENQALITGIEYATSGFDHSIDFLGADDIDPVTGDQVSFTYNKGAYRYDFIALPLGYRWYKQKGRWKIYGQASLIPMGYLRTIISNEFVESNISSGRIISSERFDYFRDFHLAASTGLGVERTIFKSWTIGLQPTFRMHLTSVTNTKPFERPWSAGLQLNIGRQLAGINPQN